MNRGLIGSYFHRKVVSSNMISCALCKGGFRDWDHVAVDILNTGVHLACLDMAESIELFTELKGYGFYRDIVFRFNLSHLD